MIPNSSPNLEDDPDEDDGATQVLISLSILVQMGSMMAQMRGIGGEFHIIHAFL